MRAKACLLAACLAIAACEQAPPTDMPATDEQPATVTGGVEGAAPAADDEPSMDEQIGNPLAELLEQDIPYGEGPDGNLVGFLAVPADAAEPLPGVLVLHEWWGLNAAVREAARRLAREGYLVLAADLYGGRTADSVADAQALLLDIVGEPDLVRDNIRQAYEYLERYAFAPRVAVVGWDLGGRWALQTALMLPEQIDAVVIFYGTVETDEALLETLDMPLLGLFGESDGSIPIADVQAFRSMLTRLRKPAEVRIYSGVNHGFFFPGDPNYSPIAADDAWLRSLALLADSLKN